MISYLESEISSFQPIIPLRSNLGPKCHLKSRKNNPRTTRPRSQSRPHAQISNGYPNMIPYLETNNSAFEPIIPFRSNLSPECDPKSRKSGPRATRPRLQSKLCAQLSNVYPKMIPYLEIEISSFQSIIPLRSNPYPECDPKSSKRGPRTTHPHSQSIPRAQLSNGYPNMIPYLEAENSSFQLIIPLRSNPGP
jgi:hypothetical protein